MFCSFSTCRSSTTTLPFTLDKLFLFSFSFTCGHFIDPSLFISLHTCEIVDWLVGRGHQYIFTGCVYPNIQINQRNQSHQWIMINIINKNEKFARLSKYTSLHLMVAIKFVRICQFINHYYYFFNHILNYLICKHNLIIYNQAYFLL